MKFRFIVFLAIIFILSNLSTVSAQVESVLAQVTDSPTLDSFAGGISGDGRFVVLESTANFATENPRNADGNLEVFLFDYAQRRIFQITDTKSLLVSATGSTTSTANIRVIIQNTRPVISNDGKWLAFGSNATCNFPGTPTSPAIINGGTPQSFDPNIVTVTTNTTPPTEVLTKCYSGTVAAPVSTLANDGNSEIWLYRIPDVAPANLSAGIEIAYTDLSAGTFIQATNSVASLTPEAGTSSSLPFIADDNRNASINDDGAYVAFVSNRDLEPCATPTVICGNADGFENDEIFVAVRNASNITLKQFTATPRPTLQRPSENNSPSISGNGLRIAFISSDEKPIKGMTTGSNPDYTEEIFFGDIDPNGNPGTIKEQITTTAPATPGTTVNVFDYGKRISRNGRFIAFDSYAELETAGSPIQTSFATYVYDFETPVQTPSLSKFVRVLPRSTADSAATGGDLRRYPAFTDYAGQAPGTLVFETRMNINSAGVVPTNADEGLNPNSVRPGQIYSLSLDNLRTPAQTFRRLTKLPTPSLVLPVLQPLTSNSLSRMSFNLSQTDPSTGNFDLFSEVFYLLTPSLTRASNTCCSQFYTGASRIPVSQSPVPTPSPTATVTPSPTPTPTGSPTPTPSPTATPIVTAPAVQGISPGMLAIIDVTTGFLGSVAPQTAVGSLQRNFTLPIELSGVTMTINGAACGLKKVSNREITFVSPIGLIRSDTPQELVITNNGRVYKTTIVIVETRPDVFSFNENPGPGGRTRIFNATNRVLIREPFNVTTLRYRGGRRVPTVLRVYLTGVQGASGGATGNFDIRVGGIPIPRANISSAIAVLREPGVFSVDFTLPPELNMAGDVPIIVSVTVNGVVYYARGDDTTSFFRIL